MNEALNKYSQTKRFGIFQAGIMILKSSINTMLILVNIFPLGVGQLGGIDL